MLHCKAPPCQKAYGSCPVRKEETPPASFRSVWEQPSKVALSGVEGAVRRSEAPQFSPAPSDARNPTRRPTRKPRAGRRTPPPQNSTAHAVLAQASGG